MAPSKRLALILLLAPLACSPEASPSVAEGALWFEGARLIVGDRSDPIENAAFLVEGDSFTWVGREGEREAPEGAGAGG